MRINGLDHNNSKKDDYHKCNHAVVSVSQDFSKLKLAVHMPTNTEKVSPVLTTKMGIQTLLK